MKESDAKKKKCPYLNAAILSSLSYTREELTGDEARTLTLCEGSNCMMWEPEYKRILRNIEHTHTDMDSLKAELLDDEIFFKYDFYRDIKDGCPREGVALIAKYVLTDQGDCGLKTKELDCNGN